MKAEQIRLTGTRQREFAKMIVDRAPDGYVVKVAAETRRDAQNRRLHAMITDLQEQVPEYATFNMEDMKLRFMDCLGTELRFLPKLEGQGLFPVGAKTSTLTVEQFSGLIELIFATGAKHHVVWSDPSEPEQQTRAA